MSYTLAADARARVLEMIPTIEQRIQKAYSRLSIIVAAATTKELDNEVSATELLTAVHDLVLEAYGELYWIKRLPALIGHVPAPTDDELVDLGYSMVDDDTDAVLTAVCSDAIAAQAAQR